MFLAFFASLIAFGVGPVLADNQGDTTTSWLSNIQYANTGAGGGLDRYDCSPSYGGDADDDGICDNWETRTGANPGLHINFVSSRLSNAPVTYVYDLSCNVHATYVTNSSDPLNIVDPTGLLVCPSTDQKDIYVELDWMTNHNPYPQAINDVVAAFLKRGIHLHVQVGEHPPTDNSTFTSSSGDIGVHYCDVAIATTNNLNPGSCSSSTVNAQNYVSLKQHFFGTVDERNGVSTFCPSAAVPNPAPPTPPPPASYNCLTAKRQVFHYGMFVNYQWGNIPSSGWAEVMGNDFIVSLGNFLNGGRGNVDEQEASFMHELGHNFGLYHGGMPPPTGNKDDDNCKPNYLSIMSYTYEFRETGNLCRPLDYSDRNLTYNDLNEQSLSDTQLGSYPYTSDNPNPPDNPNKSPACPTSGERPIWWSKPGSPKTLGHTGTTEDWNGDGISAASYPTQNINKLGFDGCNTDTTSSLGSFDDWHFILNGNGQFAHPLNFRSNPNFYSGVPSGNNDVEVGPDPTIAENEAHTDMTVHLDSTAPVVTPPPNQVITTSNPGGTTVTYPSATAIDDLDGTVPVTCTPPSDSFFNIGDTTVTCSATDAAGNTGSATFTVTVNYERPSWIVFVMSIGIIAIISAIGVWSARRHQPPPHD